MVCIDELHGACGDVLLLLLASDQGDSKVVPIVDHHVDIVGASFYYYFKGGNKYAPGECNNEPSNLAVGGIIYASYLYLFVEFAVKRFIFGVKEEGGAKKVKKSE